MIQMSSNLFKMIITLIMVLLTTILREMVHLAISMIVTITSTMMEELEASATTCGRNHMGFITMLL